MENTTLNERTTGRKTAIALATATTLLLGACADMSATQRGTATGAGIGAAAGAVLGSATGNQAGTSAVVGGMIGAVVGNVWSKRMEDRRQAMEQATRGTGVEVTRTPDDRLKLNVPNDISFDLNSAAVKPQLRGVLDAFATSLQGDAQARVEIVATPTAVAPRPSTTRCRSNGPSRCATTSRAAASPPRACRPPAAANVSRRRQHQRRRPRAQPPRRDLPARAVGRLTVKPPRRRSRPRAPSR